ncbi:MAG: DUF2306 domain-containing protein [Gemmatimonadota bacterium]
MVRKGSRGIMMTLAVLVGAYALASAFIPGARTPFVESLFSEKTFRAFGHLVAGGTAIVAGAFQFSTRLRARHVTTHRMLGRVYLVAVLVSGTSALLLAPSSSGGISAHFGFGLMAFLWVTTSVVAYVKVRAGDYASHREWMIRSYALCLAAVTLRLYLPVSAVMGIPFEEAYPAIAWLSWVPNLIIAEWFLIRSSLVPLEV